MTTYTDVFERKEVKYRLDVHQLREVRAALEGHMAPDAFGRTRVTSLYLDTPDRSLIDRSLEKPLYKEKLRIRAYGAPQPDGLVFIELKKKYKGIVYKRRVGCSHRAARAYLGGMGYEEACARFPLADVEAAAECTAPRSLQIAREIDQFLLRHQPLAPSMLIACERVAYEPTSDVPCDLRITFDESIRYRDLFAPASSGALLLGVGEAVMEIKSSSPFPLWLVHALDACAAYPTSFSKYGAAYQACVSAPTCVVAQHELRPRRYSAPLHHVKKGDRCA